MNAKDRDADHLKDAKAELKGRAVTRLKWFGIGFVIGVIALGATIWAGVFSTLNSFLFKQANAAPTVTTEFIAGKLENASDLTTAKLIYSSVCDYEEGFLPIINKSAFSMFYSATVGAGVNVSDIKPSVTEDKVTLLLPACEVREVNIDSSSIRFFDQAHSIWSIGEREQVREALIQASKEVKDQDMSELLDLADEQLENVLKGLFEGSLGDRELVIEHAPRVDATAEFASITVDGKSPENNDLW